MGRELRRVPADWEHPVDEKGNYKPMFKGYYLDELNEWLKEHNLWESGEHPDIVNQPELKDEYPFYAM